MLESRFTEIEGYKVHYWEAGDGFPVLMMHGVGPGTSILGNFEPVLEPLAERYHIFATDLIGFGNSGTKRAEPYFDVDLWVRQGLVLLDQLPDGPVGVAGHSLGGALALKVAARSDRVTHVLTSSSIGTPYPLNDALDAFWSLPQDRAELRRAMENMVFDTGALTDQMIDGRWDLLMQDGYGEYFAKMFGGDRQRYIDAGIVSDEEFGDIAAKVSLIHGRDDRPCPPDQTSVRLAERLPGATLTILDECGHNLPREKTDEYLAAAFELFG